MVNGGWSMRNNPMLDKVRTYIEHEIGLKPGSVVYVAFSGGADSTALLLILQELGYTVHALHCNFHLRGEESDRDQTFVERLCEQARVPLSVKHFDTEKVAKERGISIEMAARELRYDWFRRWTKDSPVAVAHHRDDQAETLLLNLLRGTGLRGLAGMRPIHDGIVRPLLCLSREDIRTYLQNRGQTFVTDSTNFERICQRNRLRLDVMPLLTDINPKAVEHLQLASDNVRQALTYYEKGIRAAFKELGITSDVFPLAALSASSPCGETDGLLHEWLSVGGFSSAQEREMLRSAESGVGKMWQGKTHKVLRDRHALILEALTENVAKPVLSSEIVPAIEETGPNVAYLDADLLREPIEVRLVRDGDAFVPFGMKGRKLVSDYLTDRKLNRFEKERQFVAVCGEDIVWLIGHRSSDRYKVTPATTRILKLSVKS